MIICGIDYSMSSPAMCILDTSISTKFEDAKIFIFTATKFKTEMPPNVTLGRPIKHTSSEERFENISDFFIKAIVSNGVQECAIEGYSYGSKSNRLYEIGENAGVLKHKIFHLGKKVSVFSPSQIKKYFTTKGNASKEDMLKSFTEKHSSFFNTLTTSPSPVSDIIDSYAIALLLNEEINP